MNGFLAFESILHGRRYSGNSNDFPPSMLIEVSLGKSIHHSVSPSPLRMINSVDSS